MKYHIQSSFNLCQFETNGNVVCQLFYEKKDENHENQSILPKNILFFLFLYLPKYVIGNQFFYNKQNCKQIAFSLTWEKFFAAPDLGAMRFPFVAF